MKSYVFMEWSSPLLTCGASSEPRTGCTAAAAPSTTTQTENRHTGAVTRLHVWPFSSVSTDSLNKRQHTWTKTCLCFSSWGTVWVQRSWSSCCAGSGSDSPCLWWSADSCNRAASWHQLSLVSCNVQQPLGHTFAPETHRSMMCEHKQKGTIVPE